MQVTVTTAAREHAAGEVIRTESRPGYVPGAWVLVSAPSVVDGSIYYMAMLCRPVQRTVGRKHETVYQWLSACCPGKAFGDRSGAVAYIQSMCA